ncbi:MAG: DUF3368 domain-containing protein [Bacteroidetes bacterium]|nr:DUF3368 domain-containing protein [Bacteroidota bacterium]MBL7104928.1 DUF3368 domain-containing protein [Bacteroidales bacterium]
MHRIVITDTSCLIILHKIGNLELLRLLYNTIVTTPEVKEEWGRELPDWITIEKAKNNRYQKIIETQVDKGEASVIALALEKEDTLMLLDDLKARKLAKRIHLKFTGTLGIIHKAKQAGLIFKVRPLIEKLRETDFRISENVIGEILKLSGE